MTLGDAFADRIERAEFLDGIGEVLTKVWSTLLKPPFLRDLFSGRQLGHPLHPALVLVPAGSLLSASILDAVGADDATRKRLVGIGLVSAVPTITAGWSDWLDTHKAEQRTGIVHASVNAAALTAYGVSYLRRRSGKGTASGFLGAALLGVGGWLGGHLAYAQGVGVDTTAFQSGPTEWTPLVGIDELSTALTQVMHDGVALLLTLVDGKPVAISDRCTHRGAPLSDGERQGDCVVCPWHGSKFSLSGGTVVQGPATRPEPSYEVRVVGGKVEVKRDEPRSLRTGPV